MNTTRQAKVQQLREMLTKLSDDQKQKLLDRGLVATIEGRTLSPHNTILVHIQSSNGGPTVVGGYKQWQKAGRRVEKGQHGLMIWFPVGPKDQDDNVIKADGFYTGTVFDISQTSEIIMEANGGKI